MSTTGTGYAYTWQAYFGPNDVMLVSIATAGSAADTSMDSSVLGLAQAVENYLTGAGIAYSAGPVQKFETTSTDYTGNLTSTPPSFT